jgi:S1-C subfamily serine protease
LTIPTVALRRTVDALLAHGRIRRGFVGVGAFPVRLPAKLEKQAGQSTGLLVIAVQPNSPAEQGGVTLGDALLSVDGHPLAQVDDLLEALADAVDKDLKLRVLRAGQIQELGVKVGTRG